MGRVRLRHGIAIVCAATALVYGSLLSTGYLLWDDDLNIFANPFFQNGQWIELWKRPYFGMYIPVIDSLWYLLFHAAGGEVWPFRLLNLLLHVGNVVLVAILVRGILRRFGRPNDGLVVLAAAIFALHPEQTAAVAWLSGGRDLAASFLALSAVAVYFSGARLATILSTWLFVVGLLCKPSIAGVPLAVAAYVWCFDRERLSSTVRDMSVWAVLVIASAAITTQAQLPDSVPLARRPIVAFDAAGFYLLKSAFPYPLAADYGRTPVAIWSDPWMTVPTIATALIAAICMFAFWRRRPECRMGFLWILLLTPVLGLMPFAYQAMSTVADHYNYLPLAALSAMIAVGFARYRWAAGRVPWIAAMAIVVVGGLGSLGRAGTWREGDQFFADMLAKNPASWSAKINISSIMCDRDDWQQGLPLIQGAATVAPNDARFLANETYCLLRAGRMDDVLARQSRLEDSIVKRSLNNNAGAAAVLVNSFAGAFMDRGQLLPAFAYFCQASATMPNDRDFAGNVVLTKARLREQGRSVACPGKLPWDTLALIVRALK